MYAEDETCWTLISAAAAGQVPEREAFARTYEPIVRAYLGARWRGSAQYLQDMDDAVQEVFVDCLKPRGALERFEPDRGPGFRAFLYGTVQNVARRFERKRARTRMRQEDGDFRLDGQAADEESLGAAFDRSWARALVQQAGRRQREAAVTGGEAALERVRLLELRFRHGLPIREIAKRWDTDAARLHHVYATARTEFRRILETLVRFHRPEATPAQISQECERLLELVR